MDLGIKGKKALVCASSRGLGKACAEALVLEGVNVTVNSRNERNLEETVEDLKKFNAGKVEMIVADLNTDEGLKLLKPVCSNIDILVNNNDGPPPGNFLNTKKADWVSAIESNMLSAISLTQYALPGMKKRNFGRIINITSAMVKSPNPLMILSTAARAGLTAVAKGLSKEVAINNVTINNLLPERFDTDRQVFMTNLLMKSKKITREEARAEITSSIAANRFGNPKEFGATCSFLCSIHAGFISGQNIQLDGGSYDGLI